VNGFVESRRRAKIRVGDVIEVSGIKVSVIKEEELGE
jgi:ribosome-associated protein YbcJ (S4-like RNA binding protein)